MVENWSEHSYFSFRGRIFLDSLGFATLKDTGEALTGGELLAVDVAVAVVGGGGDGDGLSLDFTS